jgi:hypothetical protein
VQDGQFYLCHRVFVFEKHKFPALVQAIPRDQIEIDIFSDVPFEESS